jgi:Transglutaminase-like superfamily
VRAARRLKRPPDLPTLRAALWALRALQAARRQLREDGLRDLRVPAPPRLPESAARGVRLVLRRRTHTCLEEALVLQRWLATRGVARDVIVGVRSPADFGAHAWLDGDLAPAQAGYLELVRVGP